VLFLTDPGGKPVIYFTQGNGELEVVPNPGGGPKRGRTANQLRAALEKGYAEVKAWQPEVTSPKVPADCSVLVVADPRLPVPKDVADAIKAYTTEARDGKKGKLIVLAGPHPKPDGTGTNPTGLEDVLAGLNVRVADKVIVAVPEQQGLGWTDLICIGNPDLAA